MSVKASEGLCPRCVARLNLAGDSLFGSESGPPTGAAPSIEEIAPDFPQLEIVECLGRGGMGVVYRARQKSLDRFVALKLIAPERVDDPEFAERFSREAQALAKLSHPNIVTIHDFGQAGGFFYLLMEFVDGVNLRQAMEAGRFTPEQALAIVPPICEALQCAHDRGIVHRDIKPENLLLDKAGVVKIADFGIAKMLGEDSATGLADSQPAGTPQYMAPEQREHQRTDHRADIYSLGVILYEMLTGELPADKLQPPSRKVQIDVRLDEIVLRALEREPTMRYQTARDFRTGVETIMDSPEKSIGKESVKSDRSQRKRAWWLMPLGAALFIIVIVAVSIIGRGSPPNVPEVIGSGRRSAPVAFAELCEHAQRLIRNSFADADTRTGKDEFTAQHATQDFQVHTRWMTGEIATETRKETGPSAEGFLLTIQRLDEPLVSQADLPQFIDRPYWKSYGNTVFDPQTGQGVAVYFDFGARLNPEFKAAMLELLKLAPGGGPPIEPTAAKTVGPPPPQFAREPDDPNSPAHQPLDLAEEVKSKRNELLAIADAGLRSGITELSEKFPALRRTDSGTLWRSLAGQSEKGTLRIDFRFPAVTTEGPPNDAPKEIMYRITVSLSPRLPGAAGPYGLTRYGRLGLSGDVIISAGNPALLTALTKLVRAELAPLADLDGTAAPKEMGEDFANFATLDDAAKGKLVWNLADAGSLFRPEHKGICRDLLATQGRYANANASSFTSAAIALARQQGWREMRALITKIYQRPTNSHLYESAFVCLRAWDGKPIPVEIVSAAETLKAAGSSQTTVQDADLAEATTLLLASQDKEAVLMQTIVKAMENPGKGSTQRGWDALVQVLTHLDAVTVRATLQVLRENVESWQKGEVERLLADHITALSAGQWGETVDGVQALLSEDPRDDGLPTFKLTLRNRGEHSPFIARQQEVAEVEIDGELHVYSGPVDVLSGPIKPGEIFNNISIMLDPARWQSKESHEPFVLTPGEHSVRVSMGLEETPSVRVFSNPVKIQIGQRLAPPPPPARIPPAALKQAESAQVDVKFYDEDTQGTPFRRLTLHVGSYEGPGSEPWENVAVSPEQMARVLDHLAQTRFFDTAKDYDSLDIAKAQPCYVLRVRQNGHDFYENLGWSRPTGVRLNVLRAQLHDEAGAAMSKLLKALKPKLAEWETASWSEVKYGLQLRVEAERPIFKVGDNVILRFTFRNTTNRPFTVLDAQDQMRGTFHQFTFTDENGGSISFTTTPEPALIDKSIGETMVRQEIPPYDTISRTVSLSGWNLAGLGHPYTAIGKEARSFLVTAIHLTPAGLDLKDPKVWVGEITARPIRIEIVENHSPISAASQSAESNPEDIAAAEERGKASAKTDIEAGRLCILYAGKPWSQGKPLFDEETGYRIDPLRGCVETPQFRAELDAYNQAMRAFSKSQAVDP